MDGEFHEPDDCIAATFESLLFPTSHVSSEVRRRAVVAIPVKDEEQRLAACLGALALQVDKLGGPIGGECFGIVVFANNCTDQSANIARSSGDRLNLPLRVVEARLPSASAHAGAARRAAMDMAEAWLDEEQASDGVILTTDADSRVAPDWIASNLAAIDAGADAVLGCIALDEEGDLLTPALHRRGRLESNYETLLTELSALFDPLDHNPWPHHATISGASIAVTRDAYREVGGLPRLPLGEDKALVAELFRRDAKLRFCPKVRVITSGRMEGRARGGVADTLRKRNRDPASSCDDALEPFRTAIKRAKWKGRLRRLHRDGELSATGAWAGELRISAADARRISRAPTFGAAWSAVEYASPLFVRELLTPADLPAQISGLRRALSRLRERALWTPEHVQPKIGAPLGPTEPQRWLDRGDEPVRGLVAS
jgi:hypothetical protein